MDWFRSAAAGRPWRLSPLSADEHGFMTFTEIELAAFLHKREELHPILKTLIDFKDKRKLTQVEPTGTGYRALIQHLIAPVDPKTLAGERLRGRARKNAGVAAAVKIVEFEELREHVNRLRTNEFDPRGYEEKGYFLRGSIKTDGYDLQLLAYKLRELNSVKFKRYRLEVLPDRLLTTTAGTGDYLTEVRNVFKCKTDVERLLGCTYDEIDQVGAQVIKE
ncbi:hypothetical protein BGZ96_005178 [Linnemannia gamsii]|uniref:Uncharacterized protein n=1 Tax=Linnemannia gamsii TaxID=64522 RepID=A0ABQ7K6Y3_9FUNG|nr:hypothetical protein BGZ96_005178 [Linnemannia gamsii]